ncbi:RagB/SusD family nutrient uptake outer membrane protein [Sphingobacterium shayense]|uniref:RagB/SusD family nutrient uptake outer membrane protein n=1 Tax=Sphingobacterium shayense TaxID=626343 RepID=UPI0015517334|nr:RagB/SusD family nutrient uptake outer membrane protein [Sphingobacterium shayense]
MKNLKTIVTIGSMIFLAACNKDSYLDRLPLSSISEPTFFKNETDLALYANEFYTSLPAQNFIQDNQSDDKVPNGINAFLAGQYVIPGNDSENYNWTNIRKVNYFLQRYNNADVAAEIKNQYAGEVRFFRAMFYWTLSKRYGDVAWYSKDLTEQSEELYAPRTPRNIVMDSILADLNFAVENIPEDVSTGRLHKYAAAALKARICLWEGTRRKYFDVEGSEEYLREALSAAQLIMNAGKYSLYSTGEPAIDYYNLFIQQELNGNPESILGRRYLQSILMNNISRTLGESGTGYSKDFVQNYLCSDGLPTALSPRYKGEDTPENEFAERDPRAKQTIATKGFILLQNSDGSRDIIDLPRIGTSSANTGYQLIKGRSSDPNMWQANQSTLDFFIFRYAEILLIYAEAKAELGEAVQSDIDNSINLLRKRAGMPNLVVSTLRRDPNSSFPNVPVLIDEIRRERRVELADEGFRFDDLLRWKAGERIERPETILGMKLTPALRARYPEAQVNGIVVNSDSYIRVYTGLQKRTWDDKMYLYPIPLEEVALNPKLGQNPGWK